jgi:histidinol-phosphatase
MRDLALDLSLAHRLANAADALSMAKYRSSELVIETKPDLTPVTDADKGIEFMIRDILSQERPLDLVIGEEFGGKDEALAPTNEKYYWVVDPIDGTKNFVRGVPTWATLIALVNPDHEVVVGVVSAPALYRRWSAHKGGGAFVSENGENARKISVSAVSSLSDASISYSDLVGWGDRRQKFIDLQFLVTYAGSRRFS